jgi:uncharacterized protein (DUF2235 family)
MSDVRNLVVACDGTWNEPDQLDGGELAPTNVMKFGRAVARMRGQQVVHYEKGVGTRAWESLPGGIYGYGLEKRIQAGYRFLRKRFADAKWQRKQNRIFIIGFSRGSYTARRLAGLISHSGIPVSPDDASLGWEMYLHKDKASARKLKKEGRFFDCPIEMVGVWDTVKATNDPDYHDNVLSSNVVAGYHAMAIDERRKFFPILRWNRDPRALQVWFAGVHSDVGGGYKQSGLADVAFEWMIYRAMKHGLKFKKNYLDEHMKPASLGKIHDSYKGIWKPMAVKTRVIQKTDWVHESVAKRLKDKKPPYRPDNVPSAPKIWSPG